LEKKKKKKLMFMNTKILLIFILFFSFNVFALNVEITPIRTNEILTLYENETAIYLMTLTNDSVEEQNAYLLVKVSEGITIIDGFNEIKEKGFNFKLKPKEKKVIELKIKVLSEAKEKESIELSYGINSLTNFTGTYLYTKKAPIAFDVTLTKESMKKNEENALIVNIQNSSNSIIKEIEALIIADNQIILKEKQLTFIDLMPSNLTARTISFQVFPETKGEKEIILVLNFRDENGLHEMQKKVKFKIEENKELIYILIAIIVIALIILLYKKFFEKKKVLEENQEIEELEEKES